MKRRTQQSIWSIAEFRRLTVSELSAGIAQGIARFALPLVVLYITDSPVLAGIAGGVSLAGAVVAGLFAGALVDRWNVRTVLLWSAAVRVAMWGSVVLAGFAGALSVPHLTIAALAAGIASAFSGPAERSALRKIVPQGILSKALAANEARNAAASLAGAPVGGLLLGLGRVFPFVATTVGLLVSLLALTKLESDFRSAPAVKRHLVKDILEGFKYVLGRPEFVSILIACAVVNFANTMFTFVIVVHLSRLDVSPVVIGLIQMLGSLGILFGSMVSSPINDRFRVGKTAIFLFGVFPVCYFAAALFSGSVVVMAFVCFFSFFLLPPMNVGVDTYMLSTTEPRLVGRLTAASETSSYVLMPLAPAAAGITVELAGTPFALGLAGGIAVIAFLLLALNRGVHRIPRLGDLVHDVDPENS